MKDNKHTVFKKILSINQRQISDVFRVFSYRFVFVFLFSSLVRNIPLQATAGTSDQAGAADNGDDPLLAPPA
jgi:hypothetical protein